MKVRTLIRRINPKTLVEIVDCDFNRLFYGCTPEITKDLWKVLVGLNVEEINPFVAKTGVFSKELAMQIRLTEKLNKNS